MTTDSVSRQAFNADALRSFAPRAPAGKPWSDYWYYYINDPATGLYKIAFLSFLSDETGESAQHAYLHIAFAPVNGERREYDYFSDQVILSGASVNEEKSYAFRFEVPGVALITESSLQLFLPEASLTVSMQHEHVHYYRGENPAASPFTGETDTAPGANSHWFIFTLGTEAMYSYEDKEVKHEGRGLTYIERGWSSAAPPGFAYLVGTSEQAKLMLVKPAVEKGGDEIWAGKIVIGEHELAIVPFQTDYHASSEIDSSEARLEVDMTLGDYRVKLTSQAPLAEFYNHVTPSQTVFHGKDPVMKTMNASLDIELYLTGEIVALANLPQSILEFSGEYYCAAMRH